jgi:hypothetical protein
MTVKEKKVVVENLMKFAHQANSKYFNGKINLNQIEFKTSARMVNTLGLYKVIRSSKKQSITLSELIINDKAEWTNTLVHEMVHAYQYQGGHDLGHGLTFKRKAAEIFNIDPKMIITAKCRNEKVSNLITAKKQARIANEDQFMLKRPNGTYGFMKNLNKAQIELLVKNKFEIYYNPRPVARVQHYRDLKSCLNARYSYDHRILSTLLPELFENIKLAYKG